MRRKELLLEATEERMKLGIRKIRIVRNIKKARNFGNIKDATINLHDWTMEFRT